METRSAKVDSNLAEQGYGRWDLAALLGVAAGDTDPQQVRDAFDDLPEDLYAVGSGRYRRYGRGMYLPWSGTFAWLPATSSQQNKGTNGYYQGSHNPEFAEVTRELPAITPEICENRLLRRLIEFDYSQTSWNEADSVWPLYVGVHLIKLEVKPSELQAISSPNELHQDGEPYVFAHLIFRHNAIGGGNLIAPPRYRGGQPDEVSQSDRLAEFELQKVLESYAVADRLVSHYVAPIKRADGPGAGARGIILTDWVPMRHHIEPL